MLRARDKDTVGELKERQRRRALAAPDRHDPGTAGGYLDFGGEKAGVPSTRPYRLPAEPGVLEVTRRPELASIGGDAISSSPRQSNRCAGVELRQGQVHQRRQPHPVPRGCRRLAGTPIPWSACTSRHWPCT